jgi:putative nucleotidyltransferase with HDIG domain
MNPSPRDVVQDVSSLISPPEVWVRLNQVVNDPGSSASDVAEVTSSDPSLAAMVLKIANSSFYNFRTRVDTISRAVTLMGMNELYSLVTAATAARVFTNIPNSLVTPETFWRHSVCTAIAARRLAKRCRVLHPERLYITGMLHDIGSLVCYNKFPDKANEALLASGGDEEVLYQAEADLLGFTHADLGAELLKLWKLPDMLIEAVAYHHEPDRSASNSLDASIVHLANAVANRSPISSYMEDPPNPVGVPDPIVWTHINLEPHLLSEIEDGLEDELGNTVSALMS